MNVYRSACINRPLPWMLKGCYQQTASGYGSKLTSRFMLKLHGRMRRIYYTCYSNTASYFILLNGTREYLHIESA